MLGGEGATSGGKKPFQGQEPREGKTSILFSMGKGRPLDIDSLEASKCPFFGDSSVLSRKVSWGDAELWRNPSKICVIQVFGA